MIQLGKVVVEHGVQNSVRCSSWGACARIRRACLELAAVGARKKGEIRRWDLIEAHRAYRAYSLGCVVGSLVGS